MPNNGSEVRVDSQLHTQQLNTSAKGKEANKTWLGINMSIVSLKPNIGCKQLWMMIQHVTASVVYLS